MGGTRGRGIGNNAMIILVLGGSRSGKSRVAESIASSLPGPVTYVATADSHGDPDFEARIERHRRRRPADWRTVEVGAELIETLHQVTRTVLVDSLGTWVAGHDEFAVDAEALCRALSERQGDTIVVSEEVGLGVHPSTEVGGRFRDALGELNFEVSAIADEVLLVVAGRVLPLAAGQR